MSVCDTAWQGSQHVTVELKLWTRHVSVEEVWPKFPRAAGSVVCAGVSFSGVSSMRQQPKNLCQQEVLSTDPEAFLQDLDANDIIWSQAVSAKPSILNCKP